MCIFPEGTRNTTDELLLPFKEGSFKMAEKTGCPNIPMALTNSADIFENHLPKIKSTHVILQYGKTDLYQTNLIRRHAKSLAATVRRSSAICSRNRERSRTKTARLLSLFHSHPSLSMYTRPCLSALSHTKPRRHIYNIPETHSSHWSHKSRHCM